MKKITHPRLKNQIVGPLLVALHAECYNVLHSCRLCYLYLVCNIPFTNSTVYFILKKKKLKKINYKGFVTFISPRLVFGVPLISTNSTLKFQTIYPQAAQARSLQVRAAEVIWSEYTRIISVLSDEDMKSSCLSICTSSL